MHKVLEGGCWRSSPELIFKITSALTRLAPSDRPGSAGCRRGPGPRDAGAVGSPTDWPWV